MDDYHCMRPSNDTDNDTIVDFTTLGVVDLDTSIMPDVFGLQAFDSQEPGDLVNTIRVLVLDATASPIGLHDVMLENLANSPDYHARMISPRDITSLRRWWLSSLFADMHKRQADMETLRPDCKQQYDREFVSGMAGTCPHCGVHVMCNLSRQSSSIIWNSVSSGGVRSSGVRSERELCTTAWITCEANTTRLS